MNLSGRTVTITGAASGIGRAMALRFAEEGAAGVVVADLDAAGAGRVADEIERRGGAGLPVGCDVTRPGEVGDLIARAQDAFGPVDLFCANAGVGGGAGLETPDGMWDLAFDVNVRSHIAAARVLVPGWVERGHGYFLSTASAAGLLNLVGSAPYAVTKHAAVAFAEWLAFTYGDRGVRVSCLCPMGVRTKLLEDGMAEPGEAGAGLRLSNPTDRLLDPNQVADSVVEGLADERFLILPHAEVSDLVRGKASDPEAWLAGMRGMQAAVAAAATGI
jgi:NAD(P)-dependent dehydrogenase (short-subunit alcohol dehydrogenase family)